MLRIEESAENGNVFEILLIPPASKLSHVTRIVTWLFSWTCENIWHFSSLLFIRNVLPPVLRMCYAEENMCYGSFVRIVWSHMSETLLRLTECPSSVSGLEAEQTIGSSISTVIGARMRLIKFQFDFEKCLRLVVVGIRSAMPSQIH